MVFGSVLAPIDRQGRVKVPLGFSGEVLPGAAVFVTADPRRRFLEVRSRAAFAALAVRVRAAAGGFAPEVAEALVTGYLGNAHEAVVDDALRIQLPGRFRDVAPGPEAVLVGVGEAVLVWDRPAFEAGKAERLRALAEAAAQVDPVLMDLVPYRAVDPRLA